MRLLTALLLLCLSVNVSRAAENQPLTASPTETKALPVSFPSCEDENLIKQVQDVVAVFLQKNPPRNIRERRSRLLTVKNIADFEPVDVASFIPAVNYNVADRLIMLKMNNRLQNEELRLCVEKTAVSGEGTRIYLLMVAAADGVEVEIVNFQNLPSLSEMRFVYQPVAENI